MSTDAQRSCRLDKAHAVKLHNEVENVSRNSAAETMKQSFFLAEAKGWRCVVVKAAVSFVLSADLAEFHVA
jgi:hypothetical protein